MALLPWRVILAIGSVPPLRSRGSDEAWPDGNRAGGPRPGAAACPPESLAHGLRPPRRCCRRPRRRSSSRRPRRRGPPPPAAADRPGRRRPRRRRPASSAGSISTFGKSRVQASPSPGTGMKTSCSLAAHLQQALGAEQRHPPGLRRQRQRGKGAGGAGGEARQHRRGVVHMRRDAGEGLHGHLGERAHQVDQHVHHVDAHAAHAAERALLAVGPPHPLASRRPPRGR